MFPDDETLTAFGRAAWAAVLAESCLKKTCRNLTSQAKHSDQKSQWLAAARSVLAEAEDTDTADAVRAWIDRVAAILAERDAMLHADRTQIEWYSTAGPVPGGLALHNWRRNTVTEINPNSLRIIASRLTSSIDGWNVVHELAREIGGWIES